LIGDRRWSARKNLALPVTLEVPHHAGPVEGRLRDLSLGGVFVETRFLLPFQPLTIGFLLPGRFVNGFRLEARMVHRRPAGAGLMFTRTPTPVIRALSEALFNFIK
jgi:hypothetical protein